MIYLMGSRFNREEWQDLVEQPLPAPEFKEALGKCAADGIVSCYVADDGPVVMELNRRYDLDIGIPTRPPQRVELRSPGDAILVVDLSPKNVMGPRGYEMAAFRFRRFAMSAEV